MGIGIVRMNEVAVGEEIRKGSLVPVLVDSHNPEPAALHAVYPPGRHRSPRVAAMLGFLVESFAHAPWRMVAAKARRPGI